jgi:hypothetical protein
MDTLSWGHYKVLLVIKVDERTQTIISGMTIICNENNYVA